jgi:DNA repair protein RadC
MLLRLKQHQKVEILHDEDIFHLIHPVLLRKQSIDRTREHLWVVGLDNHNQVQYIEQVSVGCINAVIAEPMEVFCMAVRKRCTAIILVHNHSFSSVLPSTADKLITEKMIAAGDILNIKVLDHVIISRCNHFSFEKEGLMVNGFDRALRCTEIPMFDPGFFPYLSVEGLFRRVI